MRTVEQIIDSVKGFISKGELMKARGLLLEGLSTHLDSPVLLQELGLIEWDLMNYSEACNCFTKVVSLDSSNVDAFVFVALTNLKLNRFSEFEVAIERALQLDPKIKNVLALELERMKSSQPKAAGQVRESRRRTKASSAQSVTRDVPVVILQLGKRRYLKPVISTARRFNSRLVFISDQFENELSELAEFARIESYMGEAKKFQSIYEHMSTNPYIAECFCFQRWFILNDYMEKHDLDVCFHMDSDVLLYADVGKEYTDSFNADYEFTLVRGYVGSSSYFTRSGLSNFCRFVREVYEDKAGRVFQSLVMEYRDRRNAGLEGGISDMALLGLYAKQAGRRIGEMTSIIRDSTYDHNISVSDGYEMFGPMKKIYTQDGYPYCKLLENGRFIKFNCLHFQGPSKVNLATVAKRVLQSKASPG